MVRGTLYEFLDTPDHTVEWCQEQGIMNYAPECKCGKVILEYSKDFLYRCNQCMFKLSVKTGTIFNRSKISPDIILFIMYDWYMEVPAHKVAFEYSISISSVSLWFNRFRTLASIFFFLHSDQKIGGAGSIVKIDECLLVRNKYRRGRTLAGQVWIFGGIVRGDSEQCFVEIVQKRDRATLVEVIKRQAPIHAPIYGVLICISYF